MVFHSQLGKNKGRAPIPDPPKEVMDMYNFWKFMVQQ